MKIFSLLFCILAFPVFAQTASTELTLVQRCLDEAKKELKENPEGLTALNALKIVPDSVQVERYDRKIGRQHIATQLTATLRSATKPSVMLLCLLEEDKPLFTFIR
ncbi:hypothetical protein ACP26F_01250 [Franconibacter pulveris 1160]|uniref:Uncharacterized protein n=1 Tax=Franconibacter daqui TaxID=2047724 RepID=A0ABV1PT90_9ENTR|nr:MULTISPECIES: hypothetical protein [Franconibacter]MEB5924823.1 hypothetical protein [Franconibacter daqui]GGD38794.1 hypothetical protein GCM10011513_40770 [Franconibacter daqui]